jgi:hypothetical protein
LPFPDYLEVLTAMSNTKIPEKLVAGQSLERYLDQLPALDVTDVVERSMDRILNATSPEEAAANPEAMGLRDWAGKKLVVYGVAGALPSQLKTGPSRYIVLDCADPETGERFSVTTGGAYAMATALKYWEAGWYPERFRVVELESASNPGQTSLWLVKA